MFNPQRTTMELLPVVCLCLLTCSEITSADGNGPVVVEEGSDVILPCSLSTKQNLVSVLFDWKKDQKEVFMYDAGVHYNNGRPGQDEQFKGRVSHFQDELKHGNASIIITDTKVADSGNYTCAFPRLQPRQMFYIQLVVGASPRPHAVISMGTDNELQLKCEVRGASPQPTVEWQDSDRKVIPAKKPMVSKRGELFDVTLLTTVSKNKSNHFHCVATQKELHHVTEDDVYLHVSGPVSESISVVPTGWIVAVAVLLVF